MKIAVLGTGSVGQALGTKLASLGHEVFLGSRRDDNEAGATWASAHGGRHGTFAEAAAFGEVALLAVGGSHAVAVVEAAGEGLSGKVLVDITNPLDFSRGFPPRLSVCNDDSLGEQIQRAAPQVKVVKALNTLANSLMVEPSQVGGGDHTLFLAGDDAEAKGLVSGWLTEWFGHQDIFDVGTISAARGLEAWLLLWTRLYGALGTPNFQIKLVR